jgi:predicted enzyme related to lactoylglutathione lyase
MSRSVAFYRDVLELKVDFESPYWSQLSIGEARIGLHPQLEHAEKPLGIYGKGWFLGLSTDDVRALRAKLFEHGATIHGDFRDIPGGVILDFEDPDGNPIEAYQQGVTLGSFS